MPDVPQAPSRVGVVVQPNASFGERMERIAESCVVARIEARMVRLRVWMVTGRKARSSTSFVRGEGISGLVRVKDIPR